MQTCTNCNNIIQDEFCSKCGNPAVLKRVDSHYLQHEFMHLFHLEKGFFYTVKKLLTKPGESIRMFLKQNRNQLMKPVPFLIFASLIYSIIGSFVDTSAVSNSLGTVQGPSDGSYMTLIFKWMQAHYGYANIAVSIFIAFFIKLLFKKYGYNYFEIMTLLCFVLGINMLAMTLIAPFYFSLNPRVYKFLFTMLFYGYSIWAIGQFFDKTKAISYLKAAIAFFIGYVIYFITLSVVGICIDEIIRMAHEM
jgi:Protein of unknown function (DUF3667)